MVMLPKLWTSLLMLSVLCCTHFLNFWSEELVQDLQVQNSRCVEVSSCSIYQSPLFSCTSWLRCVVECCVCVCVRQRVVVMGGVGGGHKWQNVKRNDHVSRGTLLCSFPPGVSLLLRGRAKATLQ